MVINTDSCTKAQEGKVGGGQRTEPLCSAEGNGRPLLCPGGSLVFSPQGRTWEEKNHLNGF